MIINFIGNFLVGPGGEPADETHIARSMEELGHTVRRVPRDIWKATCEGNSDPTWGQHLPLDNADINIIAKWHHFTDGKYIALLRKITNAPVFYWAWDSVDLGIEWHRHMAQEADLYLSGELGRTQEFYKFGIRFYYFQFDCVDGDIERSYRPEKEYTVIYLGSCDNQNGRIDLLKEINKSVPIQVFGHDWQTWQSEGFSANPAVYGQEANTIIRKSQWVLGTSCDPHLYGYWSNRVGRVLFAGGKLLQQYTPGMENFLHDWVEYFSTPEEAVKKLQMHGGHGNTHTKAAKELFTSKQKVIDLLIMVERYIKEKNGRDWLLP